MATSTNKRSREFEDISEISEPTTAANVHCILQELSPMKLSRKGISYYDGYVSNGNERMRLVGFEKSSRDSLSIYYEQKEPIIINNCTVKQSRLMNDLEICVNKFTSVVKSPKKFDTGAIEIMSTNKSISAKDVLISEVHSIEDGNCVSMKVKVINVAPPRAVSTGVLQEVQVADHTGSMTISLWAEHINQLEQQSCYYLKNIYVRSYCHDKSLTMSTKSSIELLSDELMDDIFCEQDVEVLGTKIVGTQSFCSHYSCVNCSGKLEEVTLDTGKCGTCKTLQLLENCAREVTCKILFKQENNTIINLQVCTQLIKKLLPDTIDITEDMLIKIPTKLDITHNNKYLLSVDPVYN